MFDRFRQSLALRLAVLYACVFAAGAALLFAALYWVLAEALESRERTAVEAPLSWLLLTTSEASLVCALSSPKTTLLKCVRSSFG
ncbi:MAG TPA: hypothetical protein PLN52_25160 [Opitutaceae bacterium]|nr:hypothetical protein [Opitutaceae bacterium]